VAIAFLITRNFGRMLVAAVLVAVGVWFLGVYLSFYIVRGPAPPSCP